MEGFCCTICSLGGPFMGCFIAFEGSMQLLLGKKGGNLSTFINLSCLKVDQAIQITLKFLIPEKMNLTDLSNGHLLHEYLHFPYYACRFLWNA